MADLRMDRIGLTFDEYVDVALRPPAGADRAIQRGFEGELAEKFPMAVVATSINRRRPRSSKTNPVAERWRSSPGSMA
jgi:hypothetical protein